MQPDLHSVRDALLAGDANASAEVERAIATAGGPSNAAVYLRATHDEARRVAANPAASRLPLAGLPVSVKDLFDIAGQPTPAGSLVLAGAAPATHDSVAVARLRSAGAAIIGRTNMTEFAFSGVGVNPHHGTPVNPRDTTVARIPGGSSSGAAVSVATGSAFIGLGSDTGGSIRIPAALNGIVGFKNTARLTPLQGALPLSETLDTVCAMTRSVRDAVLAHEVLAARTVVLSGTPLSARRFAVPTTTMLDAMDDEVARAFGDALAVLREAGATIDEIALDDVRELSTLQASGGFAAAESFAWHRELLARDAAGYDPRVATRIQRGAGMAAWEYIDLVHARQAWIAKIERTIAGYDALLSPTVPIVAPALASVAPGAERDAEFFRVNGLLLRNPSTVNMLDGCAISIPCQLDGQLPVGLMIWHGAMHDDSVLDIASQAEAALRKAERGG